MGTIKKPRFKESYCINHGRMLPIEEFYNSLNPFHSNGVLPFCKSCTNEMFKKYLKDYRTLEAACYITCAELGVPFIRRIFDKYKAKIERFKNPSNYFGVYYATFMSNKTNADTEKWISFGATDVDYRDINSIQQAEKTVEQAEQELQFIWGKDKDIEELRYLEDRWRIYTEGKELEPLQEQMYRNLCKTELDIYENKDLDKAIQRQRTIAKDLGLDQFDKRQRQSDVEKMIEFDINLMEYHDPADYYKDKGMYKDFRGINEAYVKEILRPVLNLITGSKDYKIEGEDAEKYLRRMEESYGEK